MTNEQSQPRVLVVDDDFDSFMYLKVKLDGFVSSIEHCPCPARAIDLLKVPAKLSEFDLILCDLQMPRMSGLEFIAQLKAFSDISVILMTAFSTLETAVEALRIGADDYVTKPLSIAELKTTIERILLLKKSKNQDPSELRVELNNKIIGTNAEMIKILQTIKKLSYANVNMILLGETGTGKEVIAQHIHDSGLRAKMPFIAINCTSIPENLLESELFGHAKGAFTGAINKRKGLVEAAAGGTLFLDEIGDMPMGLQGKLLRLIQEREFKPVGQNQSINADIQIIAATHRDLKKSCAEGNFRHDLYYRLNVVSLHIPPLKKRLDDIPLLVTHFMKKFSKLNRRISGITPAAILKLQAYEWPGNIRELENCIERALLLANGPMIREDEIDISQTEAATTDSSASAFSEVNSMEATTNLFNSGLTLHEIENKYVEHILKKVHGKKEVAAKLLAIDRKTLYRKVQEIDKNGLS